MQRSAQGYSVRHGFPVKKMQKLKRRKTDETGRLWLWKTVGAIITLTMICGVAGTFFVGLKIRRSLDDLAQQQKTLAHVEKTNRLLHDEKKTIMNKEHIEALAAVRLGLYAPSAGGSQIGSMKVLRP